MVLRNSLGHFKHIPCFMFSFKIIEYCFHAFIIISSHGVQINYFLLFHQNGATRPMNAQMNGYNDSKYFYKVRIEKRENGLSPEDSLKFRKIIFLNLPFKVKYIYFSCPTFDACIARTAESLIKKC